MSQKVIQITAYDTRVFTLVIGYDERQSTYYMGRPGVQRESCGGRELCNWLRALRINDHEEIRPLADAAAWDTPFPEHQLESVSVERSFASLFPARLDKFLKSCDPECRAAFLRACLAARIGSPPMSSKLLGFEDLSFIHRQSELSRIAGVYLQLGGSPATFSNPSLSLGALSRAMVRVTAEKADPRDSSELHDALLAILTLQELGNESVCVSGDFVWAPMYETEEGRLRPLRWVEAEPAQHARRGMFSTLWPMGVVLDLHDWQTTEGECPDLERVRWLNVASLQSRTVLEMEDHVAKALRM